ncbi:UPF0271 protein [Bryobacterales bacterium F-183]|nr:UPF0271 protein [Bryobacterales bacterium F-183]
MPYVDINCDMGEIADLHANGTQRELLRWCTSVNVSCGAHAGDETLIRATIADAQAAGVRVGAHPGYPDPANFGRIAMDMPPGDLAREITRQLVWFGPDATHVKPHGALYNVAVHNKVVAEAIAAGVAAWRRDVILVGLAGSPMLDVFRAAGFPVWGEAFADRAYEPDGTLRARTKPGALISDPEAAADQAIRLASRGDVQTICIHSDTPGATAIARAVRLAVDKLVR